MSDPLLVLGGTSFVGRAVARAALGVGLAVVTLNRGVSDRDVPGVEPLHADRNLPESLDVLAGRTFCAVVDVSGMAPVQVAASARRLEQATPVYALVSTVSVYADAAFAAGRDVVESDPTTAADHRSLDPAEMPRYGEQKRGAELAVQHVFGLERSLVARPGVILGPYENVRRVPYWLGRAAGGGPIIAPGRPGRSFQCVDVRDLAEWMVTATAGTPRRTGTFNALNPPGRDTWADWISLCVRTTGEWAYPRWVDDETLLAHDVPEWFGLPMWLAGESPDVATSAIEATGFSGRSLRDTVEACWAWLETDPDPRMSDYRPHPISRARELEILAQLG